MGGVQSLATVSHFHVPPPWLSHGWKGESGVQSYDLDGVGSISAIPRCRLQHCDLSVRVDCTVCGIYGIRAARLRTTAGPVVVNTGCLGRWERLRHGVGGCRCRSPPLPPPPPTTPFFRLSPSPSALISSTFNSPSPAPSRLLPPAPRRGSTLLAEGGWRGRAAPVVGWGHGGWPELVPVLYLGPGPRG
jgi:hypothetical protein